MKKWETAIKGTTCLFIGIGERQGGDGARVGFLTERPDNETKLSPRSKRERVRERERERDSINV